MAQPQGNGTIKVLIVDDNPLDAELSLRELRRSGVSVDFIVAHDQAELRSALKTFIPDVILCDFGFPDFDGFVAQRIVRDAFPDSPLIFVTGTISEERAVTALQSGAADYVLKSNLKRLPSVVDRAVRDAREKARLQVSLEQSEERARMQAARLEQLWQIANDSDLDGQELVSAMLAQGAAALRPDQHFRGVLGRINGDSVTVIGTALVPDGGDPRYMAPPIGKVRPLDTTFIGSILRTHAWDDLSVIDPMPVTVSERGWRSAISTRFEADGCKYSLTFASLARTTSPFGPEDIAYIEVLASSFAHQLQVNALTTALREREEHSRLHAERLEALWRLVNNPGLRDDELWPAMLGQAATGIQPDRSFRVTLWRVTGGMMTVEAFYESPDSPRPNSNIRVGYSTNVAGTLLGTLLVAGGGTRDWNDIDPTSRKQMFANTPRMRSLIATTFNAGGTTWGITFTSSELGTKPLRAEEHAYIEILASFFSNRVQQRWQFERIAYQQSHDVLTGLLSRSQFRSQARAAARVQSRFAVILVGIDGFREVNESYGHMIGDAILVEVGNALQRRASGGEFVGRVGGDVFCIYIEDPESREFVQRRAAEMAVAFARPFSTGDREGQEFISRTACLGIAMSPLDGTSIDTILSHADAALLTAKQRGHGSIVSYELGMEGDAHRRAALRNEIVAAIAGNQFELYYQPHVNLATGAIAGCEALIRWNHPDRGLVSPGDFIPFAEQTGLITAIDEWVLRSACAASFELAGLRPGFRLFFNLSGRQASDPKLIRAFVNAARNGVALSSLGVEITESDAMRDVEATRRVCRALRRLNVRIAIDDFGTGYSSLSFLKRLPVDIVKIDRSFISGVLTDPHDETIAETIIAISQRFGFDSLAEGAEQPEEVAWLQHRACGYVQGYAVCHPLAMEEFKAWVAGQPLLA